MHSRRLHSHAAPQGGPRAAGCHRRTGGRASHQRSSMLRPAACQHPDAEQCSPASTSQAHSPPPRAELHHDGSPSTISRRALCTTAAAASLAVGAAAAPPEAKALKTVALKDGTSVEVFEHGMSLSIVALRGSIPQDWVLNYKATLGRYAGFTLGQRPQLNDIYKELSDPAGTKNSAAGADVVTVGDAWLGPAVRAGLVQPIPNARNCRWWRTLSPRWQALVTRDANTGRPDPRGDVFAAPYRWGGTLIAYRRDRLEAQGGHAVRDWCDLLQPQLRGRVAMTDSSREFIGAALKAALPAALPSSSPAAATTGVVLPGGVPVVAAGGERSQRGGWGRKGGAQQEGAPAAAAAAVAGAGGVGFNSCVEALAARGVGVEEVAEAARALRRQVRLFSSRDHVRAFTAGDVWAVVGWSQDLITLAERSNSVEVLVPRSGTALFADMWAVPRGAQGGHMQVGPSPLLPSWLEFSLMPARTLAHTGLKTGAAPLLLDNLPRSSSNDDTDSGVLTHEHLYLPGDAGCLARSDFLTPLDAGTLQLYKDALQRMQEQPLAL